MTRKKTNDLPWYYYPIIMLVALYILHLVVKDGESRLTPKQLEQAKIDAPRNPRE